MTNQQTEIVKKDPLAESLKAREMDVRQFRVIKEILYPNVQKDETLLMAIDYCRARKLDIMKRPIQIVPIWSSKEEKMKDTIWPSIVEIRATAARTGEYAGQGEVEFGATITKEFSGEVKQKGGSTKLVKKSVTFPEWGKLTVYRLVKGEPRSFTAKLYWTETYKTLGYNCEVPNDMWSTRAFAQFEKCIEAAALRKAFPEEIGSDYIAEEAFDTNDAMVNITPNKSKTASAHTPPAAIEESFRTVSPTLNTHFSDQEKAEIEKKEKVEFEQQEMFGDEDGK